MGHTPDTVEEARARAGVALSATEGARRGATHLLGAAARAASKLLDEGDDEALHDFRVALRRLNAWLKVYRPLLGRAASRKLRRRLRDVAGATGAARDADVQFGLLHAWCDENDPRHTGRFSQALDDLDRARSKAARKCRKRVARNFPAGHRELERRLERRRSERGGTFGAFAADVLEQGAGRLFEALAASTSGPAQAHAARLAAKEERYVLEAFEELPQAERLLAPLRDLQDVLGELHDVEVLVSRFDESGARPLPKRDRPAVKRHFDRRAVALTNAMKRASVAVNGPRWRRGMRSLCEALRDGGA